MIRAKNLQVHKPISGINITPFTDVCLVLLIIFMVTANIFINENSLHITLPKADSTQTTMPKTVTVLVTIDNQFFVDKLSVTREKLQAVLQQRQQETNSSLLIVKADEDAPYKYVIFAIDTARKVGLTDIALATQLNQAAALTQKP